MSEQIQHALNVAPHQRPHVLVSHDAGIVQTDNLQAYQSSGHQECNGVNQEGKGCDIFALMDRVDKWRQSQDILFRLFTSEDETELREHVLGIIAAPNTTLRPGLLEQMYQERLSPRARDVFYRIQCTEKSADTSSDPTPRRIQMHFVLLVALAVENEFCQYIVSHSHARDRLRYFINEHVQPALQSLLRGEMLSNSTHSTVNTTFGVLEFVEQCRFVYATHCVPMPVYTIPPTTLGSAPQRLTGPQQLGSPRFF